MPGRDARLLLAVSNRRRTLPSSDVMTKHSKNNTASSIFSYAERKKLDYGTKGVCTLVALVFLLFRQSPSAATTGP